MATFEPKEKSILAFNDGEKYEDGDPLDAETINNVVESQLYTQGKVIERTETVGYTENADGYTENDVWLISADGSYVSVKVYAKNASVILYDGSYSEVS